MEKHKTCSFIGHRKIEITTELIKKLSVTIKDLIVKENVSIFLFSSYKDKRKLFLH